MIVFLYGRDGYRLRQNLEKVVNEYKKKHTSGMSFSVLDFDNASGPDRYTNDQSERLVDLIKTNTFFNEKRLVVLKNTFSAASQIANLIETWNLAGDQQRIFVFAENYSKEELAKKDKKFFNLLNAKPNVVKTCDPLDAREIGKWADNEIEKTGMRIEPDALKKLVGFVSGAQARGAIADPVLTWRLKQEIDKLADYKSADKNKVIKVSDVEALVMPNIDLNIFDVVDAFATRNKPKALIALYGHLESGADPYYIFSMLVYQFRNLLRVKSLAKNAVPYANIVKKTGLNPFVARKTYEQCKKFDLDELKQLFSKLAQTEMDAKNGKTDMPDGLYKFIFSLT